MSAAAPLRKTLQRLADTWRGREAAALAAGRAGEAQGAARRANLIEMAIAEADPKHMVELAAVAPVAWEDEE